MHPLDTRKPASVETILKRPAMLQQNRASAPLIMVERGIGVPYTAMAGGAVPTRQESHGPTLWPTLPEMAGREFRVEQPELASRWPKLRLRPVREVPNDTG
jgi:hypothetical protein